LRSPLNSISFGGFAKTGYLAFFKCQGIIPGRKGGLTMAKTYTCRDVGVDCDWRVRGETEEEVMQKIRDHARVTHDMQEIPKDLALRVRDAIHDEKQ